MSVNFSNCLRLALMLVMLAEALLGQVRMGRIVFQVQDETGAAISGLALSLESSQTHIGQTGRTDSSGRVAFRGLPFGIYAWRTEDARFETGAGSVIVNSEVSKSILVNLRIRRLLQEVTIPGLPPLIDPEKTSASLYVSPEQVRRRVASLPNRDAINLVAVLPGWVLEGNGVLHPRGAEYQTQYVIDGIPVFDNRSPAFASGPLLEATDSMEVITGGIPAEFGRKLGGVVNVASRASRNEGRGELELHGGSQSLLGGGVRLGGAAGKLGYSGVVSASRTSRYLDPPAIDNFHNQGQALSGFLRLDYLVDSANALRLFAWGNGANLQVPNEPFQEEAGQRQLRRNRDANLSLGWEHYASSEASSSVVAYARQVSSSLTSNPLSTPVISQQERRYQAYGLMGSYSWMVGRHQLKTGGDLLLSPVREFFSFAERTLLPPKSPAAFQFLERRNSLESAFFLQDRWSWKNLTAQVGLRFDQYHFLVRDSAWSPRLGLSYFVPRTQTRFHFAYDRAFQTPSIENLLLSSSEVARALRQPESPGELAGLPVPTSRAHFFEAGFSQALGRYVRLDGQVFQRRLRNFEDDDVFFNTGISFPISLGRARIQGSELRLELQRWKGLSGFASYSNLLGTAFSPVTGGLFVGEEARELLQPGLQFPISQDQRNTLHSQVQYQPKSARWWLGLGYHYESGLPVELGGEVDEDDLEAAFAAEVLNRVDLSRGRVKPRHLWDASAGLQLWREEHRRATLQMDCVNLANRFYLINFNGLFSGTAIGLPRTVSAKLSFQF